MGIEASTARQCADAVLMVRPAAFGFNPETAHSNRFQREAAVDGAQAQAQAQLEFDRMVAALRSEGVQVCVAEDAAPPARPDAVFPNNWVSFHADGTVVLYPMAAASRRSERRLEIVQQVCDETGFAARRTVDLSSHERGGRYLEGTGSLVLDHVARVAYACRSDRTDAVVLDEWCAALGYEAEVFDALDDEGSPIYHTNVMLCIAADLVLVGGQSIVPRDRERVLARLAHTGRELVSLDSNAIAHFAANALELASWDEALGDCRVLVLSAAAHAVLPLAHRARLAAGTDTLLVVPVPTIERLGGGSVRCMLAEIHRGGAA